MRAQFLEMFFVCLVIAKIRIETNKGIIFVRRPQQGNLPMRATHLQGYHIETVEIGDTRYDASNLIAPSNRLQQTV